MYQPKKIAIVTGAAGGLGREIVRHLLLGGFYVAATDVCEKGLESLQNDIEPTSRLGCFFMDVADVESIQKATAEILQQLEGDIAVLVNNAGILIPTPILFSDNLDKVKKTLDINLLGTYYCTNIFAKYMAKRKFGRIINISSIAATWGAAVASAYAGSKAGLIAASQSWARELGPFGVCVNAIAPGVFQTQMIEQVEVKGKGEVEKEMLSLIPVRRLGSPEDIAELVLFLATCKTNYLNGAVITLDGGLQTGSIEATQI